MVSFHFPSQDELQVKEVSMKGDISFFPHYISVVVNNTVHSVRGLIWVASKIYYYIINTLNISSKLIFSRLCITIISC